MSSNCRKFCSLEKKLLKHVIKLFNLLATSAVHNDRRKAVFQTLVA